MGTVRKTITRTEQQDNWAKAQINPGHYTNDSECIRNLFRREQERSAEIDSIRSALIEGETVASLVDSTTRCCGVQAKHAGHTCLNSA